MAPGEQTRELLRHLASRPGHDEVKADYRDLLVAAFGVALHELEFERRVPEVKGRLDALIGRTVFEAKSNLDREWGDVLRRMPDYLADREREEGERFVGIASDGRKWVAFERTGDGIAKIKEIVLDPEQPDAFLAWLDGVVALGSELPPEPLTIRIELGQDSVAFRRARAKLEELWARLKGDPAVILKRQLWAQLLKLVYGQDVESDALFFQHTFLVVVAKAIALAVMDMREDDPARILSGQRFADAGIAGAVESDFFDWIVADAEGADLVRRIVAHVRRFRLREVESDILKVLYESLIEPEQRHGLGEYYTPDWVAAKIVRHAVAAPHEQKVLDPACGSGTFLFHAVRNYLAEAEENGVPLEIRAAEAAALVAGLDVHPVAVIIARVTYLLALAPALSARKGRVPIPVYLGDAMQLSVTQFMTEQELAIDVPADADGQGATRLIFPELFCRDAELFDTLIEAMRAGAEAGVSRDDFEEQVLVETQRHYVVVAARNRQKAQPIGTAEENAAARLGETYLAYDTLRRAGRDSIWTYVARNLSRPLSLSVGIGWANVVVGNPPWVAFRHMNAELQTRFRELAKGAKVYVGGKFATQSDLAALFTVRGAGLYLRNGGRLAFVLPLAALTRGQFEKLRTGSFTEARIAWDEVWTIDVFSDPPQFPVPACVVFGRRRAVARPLPDKVRAYTGDLPFRDAPEAIADDRLTVVEGAPKPAAGVFTGGSPYRAAFRDGATLYPRMLCLVERPPAGRLGSDVTTPFVVSRQTSQDKRPWSMLPKIEHRVEAEFLRPVLLGESILPYRLFRPFEGVVPVSGAGEVLNAQGAAKRGIAGLRGWMQRAEATWEANKRANVSLVGQFDYFGKLATQFPIATLRVVYAKAGTQPAACLVKDATAVIDHKLYWSAPASEDEGRYLTAVLNSETARSRVAALQSRGQWGARDFDKVMFTLPIPAFSAKERLHRDLAAAAAEAEAVAAAVPLEEGERFQRARRLVRDALAEAGLAARIDALVARLLDE